MSLQLPDGSTVKLAPGATIHYREDLGRSEIREIRMDGKVVFDVTRAKEQPLVVYCEGLQTKVLGTIFSVTATRGSDRIKVKLLEGKVLVSLDEKAAAGAEQDYYLFPGEELVFDKLRHQVAISRGGRKDKDVTGALAKADSLSNWYMFNNQGLAGVFNQLSAIYNVPIEYSRADIQKMYFIGKLEKKDSINKILQDIALLNHLTVTMKGGKYIITKKNP
jgi:ferric-dicitrate binding protein FerR (iron transport regulator)